MAIVNMSRCAAKTEQGAQVFEITGYSLRRGIGVGRFVRSAYFAVGGHNWSILFYPDGFDDQHKDSISVGLELMRANAAPVRASAALCLFHPTKRQFSWSSAPAAFDFGYPSWKFRVCSVNRRQMEASGYVAGDRLMLHCVVTVIKGPLLAEANRAGEPPPPPGIARHLGDLLEGKEHSDVTFEVEGEEFPAHRLVLAMRSPVLKAELYGPMMEKGVARFPVADMKPDVFRALLHFIYTDSLPATDDLDGDYGTEMIRHLLVAADRYAIERLKVLCETILCKRLDVQSVASTLGLADQHGCSRLKDACIRFIASSSKLDDMVASQGYRQLKRTCPNTVVEMWENASRLRKTWC